MNVQIMDSVVGKAFEAGIRAGVRSAGMKSGDEYTERGLRLLCALQDAILAAIEAIPRP